MTLNKNLVALATLLLVSVASVVAGESPSNLFVGENKIKARVIIGSEQDRQAAVQAVELLNLVSAKRFKEESGISRDRLGSFVFTGDVVELGTRLDELEIGEKLGDLQKNVLKAEDLEGLKSSTIQTGRGETRVNQYISFIPSNATVESSSGAGRYTIPDASVLFEYRLEFEEGLRSDINGSRLPNWEDRSFNILGRQYKIIRSKKVNSELRFSLVSAPKVLILREGETKEVPAGDKNILVEVVVISEKTKEVLIKVNGEFLPRLRPGDFVQRDGYVVSIHDMLLSNKNAQSSTVRVMIGTHRLDFRDDFSDGEFTNGGLTVNGQIIEDSRVKIEAVQDGDIFSLKSIAYQLKMETNSEKYCKEIDGPEGACLLRGESVKQYLRKPEAMLPNWNIYYGGVDFPGVSKANIRLLRRDAYALDFQNLEGLQYTVPLIDNSNSKGRGFAYGDEDNNLIFVEARNSTSCNINPQDFLILTSKNTDSGFTHVLRYESADRTNKVLSFSDLASGAKHAPFSTTGGTLYTAGIGYAFSLCANDSIAIDQNNDGSINGGKANIVTKGGLVIDLGTTNTPVSPINVTLHVLRKLFEERTTDLNITIQITNHSQFGDVNEVDLNVVKGATKKNIIVEGLPSVQFFGNPYVIFLTIFDSLVDNRELEILFPLQQVFARLYVGIGPVGVRALNVPPKIYEDEIVVAKDGTEISGPVILMGGPCANIATRKALGIDEEDCLEPFEAKPILVRKINATTIVVAGLTKQHTRMAVQKLEEFI